MSDVGTIGSNENDEAMIAVMGHTGSGKSSFIKLLTGDSAIHVGHTLDSDTDVVRLSHLWKDGRLVTLVDTPGFDDSRHGVSDAEVLKRIALFLKEEYEDGRALAGVIYLHRISDPRVGGISRANLRMFKQLCGSSSLANVVIATTFWDSVTEKDGTARMDKLQRNPNLFQPIIAAGGKIMSHNDGFKSAHSIVDTILLNEPKALQIQVEMKQGKTLLETSAGLELDKRLTQLITQHKEEMQTLRDEVETVRAQDEASRNELKELRDKLETEVARWQNDKKKLEEDLDGAKAEAKRQKAEADALAANFRKDHDSGFKKEKKSIFDRLLLFRRKARSPRS